MTAGKGSWRLRQTDDERPDALVQYDLTLNQVLDAVARFSAAPEAPPEAAMQAQLERMRMQNLFTQPWV